MIFPLMYALAIIVPDSTCPYYQQCIVNKRNAGKITDFFEGIHRNVACLIIQ